MSKLWKVPIIITSRGIALVTANNIHEARGLVETDDYYIVNEEQVSIDVIGPITEDKK